MSAAPRLVVDLDVLERNIETMAARGRRAGLPIRPHAKTHKIPRIAAMQRDAGARGFTLATISEAEVFAAAGFDDLFIAYPLWVDAEDGARLARLSESAQITVGCDNLDAARSLRRHTGAASLRVLIEVDSGQHRSGVTPGDAGELAAAVAGLGLDVVGAFTFPGTPTPVRRAAAPPRTSAPLSHWLPRPCEPRASNRACEAAGRARAWRSSATGRLLRRGEPHLPR